MKAPILDEKDRRLLLELDTDATKSLSELARILRVSKEAIAYRIRRLEEQQVITHYIALAHFAKLGLAHYKLYIKYSHATREKRQQVIEYLKKEPTLGWLASSEGNFDLMIAIRFPTLFDFEAFKDRLFSKFDTVFQRNSFAILTEAETYPRQYLINAPNPARKVFVFCSPAAREKLDVEDLLVIKAISQNSRASSVAIAQQTGLTDRVVRYRRQQLEKRGVIVGSKLAINYRALNYVFFKCFIKFQRATDQRMQEFRRYARQHPNIIHWLKVVGEWDLELEVEAPSVEAFYQIANDIRGQFADIVQTFDAVLVSDEHVMTHA